MRGRSLQTGTFKRHADHSNAGSPPSSTTIISSDRIKHLTTARLARRWTFESRRGWGIEKHADFMETLVELAVEHEDELAKRLGIEQE